MGHPNKARIELPVEAARSPCARGFDKRRMEIRNLSSHVDDRLSWIGAIGLAVAVGVAYFFAAQLSLTLLTKPDGVAVFWPAAGIASGTLIALGSGVRVPVTVGVLAASALASLLGDRSIPAATIFALCNAGEPLLVAWLIKRWLGTDFRLESLASVLGFFAAAAIPPAISGSIATVGFVLFYSSSAPLLTTWLNWFASDALGIIMVAPLLIGLGSLRRESPAKWELVAGTLTLAALVMGTAIALRSPQQYWYTVLPLGMLLPALLAAYCRPVFAAAAALVLSFAVVWITTFGIGDFGEPPNLHDRVYAARATLLAISAGTLLLAALFAERRNREAVLGKTNERLKETNDRLQLALHGAKLGVWSLDIETGRFESDARDRQIHNYPPDAPPETGAEARSFIHPGDLPAFDAALAACERTGDRCTVEYRVAPAFAGTDPGQERWVAIEGATVRDAKGEPTQWLGITRDISERKQVERSLAERDLQLALASKYALVGTFTFDTASEKMEVSTGYAAIHELPEDTREIHRDDWRAGVHPDDLPSVEAHFREAIAARRCEHFCEYRIVARGGEVRWIDLRSFITYGSDAGAARLVGANIDITERKRAELALTDRNAQFELARKVTKVGSFTYDYAEKTLQLSPACAAIYGLPEHTLEISQDDWRTRILPDDLAHIDALTRQAMANHQSELVLEFRIVRPGGEVRWTEFAHPHLLRRRRTRLEFDGRQHRRH